MRWAARRLALLSPSSEVTERIEHVADRPVGFCGLGALLGSWCPDRRRPIRHGDRVPVLLLGQERAADNGPWIAQDGEWERPSWCPDRRALLREEG